MSKLVVDGGWLEQKRLTEQLAKESYEADTDDKNTCFSNGVLECIESVKKQATLLTPAQEQAMTNPAAQFAGRMEANIDHIVNVLLRVGRTPSFDTLEDNEWISDRYKELRIVAGSFDKAQKQACAEWLKRFLADIAAVKEAGDE